jgi:hypothetical protein
MTQLKMFTRYGWHSFWNDVGGNVNITELLNLGHAFVVALYSFSLELGTRLLLKCLIV